MMRSYYDKTSKRNVRVSAAAAANADADADRDGAETRSAIQPAEEEAAPANAEADAAVVSDADIPSGTDAAEALRWLAEPAVRADDEAPQLDVSCSSDGQRALAAEAVAVVAVQPQQAWQQLLPRPMPGLPAPVPVARARHASPTLLPDLQRAAAMQAYHRLQVAAAAGGSAHALCTLTDSCPPAGLELQDRCGSWVSASYLRPAGPGSAAAAGGAAGG